MNNPSGTSPAPEAAPLDLTEYESGFVDGYLIARGIFDTVPSETRRALAALKKSKEQAAKAAEG